MNQEEEIKKVFEMAALNVLTTAKPKEIPLTEEEQKQIALDLVNEQTDKEWNALGKAMNGKFAKRMLEEMEGLTGREYVRQYMKLLEFFRPKITRIEGELKKEEKQVLQVEYIDTREQLEQTIDINHEEQDEERK